MGTCQDCRFWERHGPPFDTDWGTCRMISGDDDTTPRTLASAMGREDGEGYLLTRPAFGCVQFEVTP